MASSEAQTREAQKKLDLLEISQENGRKSKKRMVPAERYLADHINQWESFIGADGGHVRLFKIPPPLSMIPVRPFILDSAPKYIKQPDLSARLPQEQSSSMFSRLLGNLTSWK